MKRVSESFFYALLLPFSVIRHYFLSGPLSFFLRGICNYENWCRPGMYVHNPCRRLIWGYMFYVFVFFQGGSHACMYGICMYLW